MDEDKAARDVVAMLRTVARSLRAHDNAELLKLVARLEEIAQQMELFAAARAREGRADPYDAELIADTLQMLETFRQIRSPALRRSVIDVIRAMRPDADSSVDR